MKRIPLLTLLLFLFAFSNNSMAQTQNYWLDDVEETNSPSTICHPTSLDYTITFNNNYPLDVVNITTIGSDITIDMTFVNGTTNWQSGTGVWTIDLGTLLAGNYNVVANIYFDGVLNDSIGYALTVEPSNITANFVYPPEVCTGVPSMLINTSTLAASQIWYENGVPVDLNEHHLFAPTSAGTYVVRLRIFNGFCQHAMQVAIIVHEGPVIDSFNVSESVLCMGESIDLESSSTGGTSTSWYENGALISNLDSITHAPPTAGNFQYTLSVSNANCTNSVATNVTVNPLPTFDTFNVSDTTLCLGETVYLSSTSANATSFEWRENGVSVANTSDYSVTPSPEGIYTYQLLLGTGNCFDSTEQVVEVVPLPIVDLGVDTSDCFGPVELDAGPGLSYLWQDQSTNQTLTPTATGMYSVTVTDANGCSSSDEMSFQSCAAILENSGMEILVYPNPVVSNLNIDLDGYEGEVSLRVTDMKGKLISSHSQFTMGNIDLDLSELTTGMYYLHLTANNSSATLKIIKE